MTHAALKDLLPCPFCGRSHVSVIEDKTEAHLVVCEDCISAGPPEQSEAEAITAWNRRAALSAMEGEAVAWQVRYRMVAAPGGWGQWHEWSLPDRPFRVNGWDAEYRPLYTAPPPQQSVVPALEVFRIAGGDVECCPNPTAAEARECLRDLRECYDESLATHPTPSPGPQGATPPQPEAADWHSDIKTLIDNGQVWHDASQNQACAYVAARDRLMKAIGYGTAALTTSGRDGDG